MASHQCTGRCPQGREGLCTCYVYYQQSNVYYPAYNAPLPPFHPQPQPPPCPPPAPPTTSFVFCNETPEQHATRYQQQEEPPAFRTALGQSSSLVVNAAPRQTSSNTNKRKTNPSQSNTRDPKRRAGGNTQPIPQPIPANITIPGIPIPAAYGVGPIHQPPTPAGPSFSHRDGPTLVLDDGESTSESPSASHAAATDAWYFTRGIPTSGPPPPAPPNDKLSGQRADERRFKYLTCRLCTGKFKNWQNKSSSCNAIRRHMKKYHRDLWSEMVVKFKLKNWETVRLEARDFNCEEREPFTLAGFYERLLRWIAVDDQSVAVVESPELRELLLYIGVNLTDRDIPHRTKVSTMLTTAFKEEYAKICAEIRSSPGRTSLTSDVWSRIDLRGCMAITAHYLKKDPKTSKLVLRSELIAFRRLFGSHSGVNMGQVFFGVLKEVGCLSKLGTITLDNASNNQTMMKELEEEFTKHGIAFDSTGNRIRCFPHVVNIAVKTSIKELPKPRPLPPPPDRASTPDPKEFEDKVKEYSMLEGCRAALQSDVVSRVRSFVTACRASIERREKFDRIIEEGNARGGFGNPPKLKKLKPVGLLKDVDTRWSSTYNMINRFLQQYPACERLIQTDWDLSVHCFTESENLLRFFLRFRAYPCSHSLKIQTS